MDGFGYCLTGGGAQLRQMGPTERAQAAARAVSTQQI
jgi:hypothetical protein